jgi:hypothetical protein
MAQLSPDQLKSRLALDFQVCQHMFGAVFSGEAYRNSRDLQKRRDPVTLPENGYLAVKYRIDFYVKTLVGRRRTTDTTTIGFDLEMSNYPYEGPHTWLISSHVPYSPHFRRNVPSVCIDPFWEDAQGEMLLGELLVHIARMLNWDGNGRGYPGWNFEAAAFYQQTYGDKPITANLLYPLPPNYLLYGLHPKSQDAMSTVFRPHDTSYSPDTSNSPFSTSFRRRGNNG